MNEKPHKEEQNDRNKLAKFIQNNPLYIILGLILIIFQTYQMIDLIVNKAKESSVFIENIQNQEMDDEGYIILGSENAITKYTKSELKNIFLIIISFMLSIIIFFLIYKNTKKNYIIKSLPYNLIDLMEMKEMGIVQCTSKLSDTDFTPTNCMNTIKKKLFFMGVGGAKWIQDPANFQLFRKMLLKVTTNNGEVKFLIIHPYCNSFKLMKEQREGAIVTDSSYKNWISLIKEFPCLQVRCYDHTPTFRLQFMDDTLMAVSRYQFEREQYDNFKQGWDSPHLIIDNTHVMSFYNVFEKYYIDEWNDAKDIVKIKELN